MRDVNMIRKSTVRCNHPPRGANNIKITGIPAVDIRFHLGFRNFTSTPDFFHIDATANRDFLMVSEVQSRVNLSGFCDLQPAARSKCFRPGVKFFPLICSNGEGSGLNPAVTSGVNAVPVFTGT